MLSITKLVLLILIISALTAGLTTFALRPSQHRTASQPFDLVTDGGADPTGGAPSDNAFTQAMAAFTKGGTITGCGAFTITKTILVVNNALEFASTCGPSGSTLGTGATQLGGFTIQSSTNKNVPDQTAGPLLTAGTGGGTLAAGTYYVATTLQNGAGETKISPAASVQVGANGTITVSYPQYQSGGWGYNIYCGKDSKSLSKQPATNFVGNGSYTGPPFLVGVGTSSNPVLNACTASGVPPPTSNTASHGMVLVQVGTTETNVNAGPVFKDVTFLDPTFGTLGGGIVVVQAQRTKLDHCYWRGFQWAGTKMGGMALYEYGAIGLAILSNGNTLTSATNFTSVQDPNIESAQLAILNLAPDTDINGGNITTKPGGAGIDAARASANVRITNMHFAPTGTGAGPSIIIRGNKAGKKYTDIVSGIKVEGVNRAGPAVLLNYAANMLIDLQCSGDTPAGDHPCVWLDADSRGNNIRITNQLDQCPFSDGTTCYVDPSKGNNIIVGGNQPGLWINGVKK